ncbi:hypothetical protein K8O68_09455 [Salipaludibacillus sp. CUR1]|uniref:hypothetical protein n=1 Tax=Salipaludibacillus sp. CUR1 TaxID=2820003 RepID=UPI001E5E3B4C|nr:hypothetical protein [Salipaludibacillus sp. CUR1]MCE7792640.1 hypothetical protein [Salipaludibacillus sp. CUR1]
MADKGQTEFTQKEVDQVIADRLERFHRAEERLREKAIESGEEVDYKAEYERLKQEHDEWKAKQEDDQQANYDRQLQAEKERLELLQAEQAELERAEYILERLQDEGFTDEKAESLITYIAGNTEDEIDDSINLLVEVRKSKPKYGDPSPGPVGNRKQPKQKDGREHGRSMYQRLRGKLGGR